MAVSVRGENQGFALTQVFAMGGAVLAGLWFPFELLPSFAQAIGKFTPQYWEQTGLQTLWSAVLTQEVAGAFGTARLWCRWNPDCHAAVQIFHQKCNQPNTKTTSYPTG